MAYVALILFFAAAWLAVFTVRNDLRRSMVLVSLFIAPLGPLSELWFLRDYWKRETMSGANIAVEDVLFSYFLGGATFAIYKVVFRKKLCKTNPSIRLLYMPFLAAFITVLSLVILTNLFDVNSIFSSSLAFVATSTLIWYKRPDLIRPSLVSGLLSVTLFVVGYSIVEFLFPGTLQGWCLACNPTGLRFLGINIEELVWDFTWGLVGGVIFEATTGIHIRERGSPHSERGSTASEPRPQTKTALL